MSLKSRLERKMRANLNTLLDAVQEFEAQGGFRKIIEPIVDEIGFEELGPPPSRQGNKTIRDYYANLEVPYGSDLSTVKESYRRLMRKYHPDKHVNDPESEKLATELSQELTRAYTAIEAYLTTGRY
jgi:DnaJ-domain-containing protein 1